MPRIERIYDGFLPGQHAIEAYGQGGFRFGGMSHRGSLLLLPSGVHRWDVARGLDLQTEHFVAAAAEASEIDILLLGLGATLIGLDPSLRLWLKEQGCGSRQ